MLNEKRLIDVSKTINHIQRHIDENVGQKNPVSCFVLGFIIKCLEQEPAVDVVEVKHGRWQPHYEIFDADPAVGILGGNYQTGWQCSVCGRYESIQEPYCNCGAKMDGDGDG
jgi:hypothetical protein